MALHKSHGERSHDADAPFQHASRTGSGRQSFDKRDAVEEFLPYGQHEPDEERGRGTEDEEESDSDPNKRQREPHGSGDAKEDQDDTEYRRMRRRITNRESAKRMRIKRQEELANFQKELKRVTLENEHLRRFSAHLQKQHIILATDVQHWQAKCNAAQGEINAIFQQLQQVVAISAAFNPAILEAVGKAPAQVSPAQAPVLDALTEALPQARMLSELMEALRKTGQTGNIASALTPLIPTASASTHDAAAARPAVAPLNLPTSGPLSAANLTAIRLAAAAHAENRAGGSSAPLPLPGVRPNGTAAPNSQQLLAPKPIRPGQGPAPGQDAKPASDGSALLAGQLGGEARSSDPQAVSAASDFANFDLEAVLRAAQNHISPPA